MASDWLKKVQGEPYDIRFIHENGEFLSIKTNLESNTTLFSEENEIFHDSL
jgi:hypothetical protein